MEQEKSQVANSPVTISEERIRQIVQEELAKWEKQQVHIRRFGVPMHAETKAHDERA